MILRVGSLNCEYLRDGHTLADAVKAAEHKHGKLDVLALQEISTIRSRQLRSFAAELGMNVSVLSTPDAEIGLGNALLVRADGPAVSSVQSWTLQCRREDRSAVALELATLGIRICCTHLDHQNERVRLNQLGQLHGHLHPIGSLLLLGDFNAIRRADYNDDEWTALVRGREQAHIETETAVVDELERPLESGGVWGLTPAQRQIVDGIRALARS